MEKLPGLSPFSSRNESSSIDSETDSVINNGREQNYKKELKKYIIIFVSIIVVIIILFIIILIVLIVKNKKNSDGKIEEINIGNIAGKEIKCQTGYFMPYDSDECKKCTIENCEKCYGIYDYDVCTSCYLSLSPLYENNRIISCKNCKLDDMFKCSLFDSKKGLCTRCETGYTLIDNKCMLKHSIKAIYKTTKENEYVQLINNTFIGDIIEMIIDNKNVTPRNDYNFTFCHKY